MKRRNMLLYMLCIASMGFSQQVKVKKTEKQTLPSTGFYPVLNESGTKLLYSRGNFQGLILRDLNSGKEVLISDKLGSGYNPVFEKGGDAVYFREERTENGKRLRKMMSYNLNSGNYKYLLSETSNVQTLNRMMARQKDTNSLIEVASEDLELIVYKNGQRKVLKPFDKVAGYIWVSLSPNKDKILFTASGKGTFICDIDGNIIASLGYVNAPVWYNEEWVVGMEDKDNGEEITSSSIIIVNAKSGERVVLTSESQKAMFPSTSVERGRIAYNTLDGEIYVMDIEIE